MSAPAAACEHEPKPQRSLRATVTRASIWALGGNFASQFLRLAANLVLTRLLMPEVFGIMALVNVMLRGLEMFADVGARPAIVQHRSGDTEPFLRTAFTIQIARGVALYAVVVALSWPAAWWFGRSDPSAAMLTQLLPVAGLSSILNGVTSTRLATLSRKLQLGRQIVIELGAQAVGAVVMIVGALLYESVWALVAGSLAASAVTALLSHVMIPGGALRPAWDRECASELFRFGKWIFLSTAFSFLAARGDRLVMGSFLSLDQLGVYSIAVVFSQAVRKIVNRLSQNVVMPAYADLARRDDPERFRRAIRKVKVTLLGIVVPPAIALALLGDWVIRVLYTQPFHDAGWMLQVLSVGTIGLAVTSSSLPVLLASGDSFRHFMMAVTQTACLLGAMWVGGSTWGALGLVVGAASVDFLSYPVLAMQLRRHDAWVPQIDLAAIAVSALVGLVVVSRLIASGAAS